MRRTGRILLQGLLVRTLLSAQLALAQTTYQFDLPPQPLADALRSVGRVTHTNVLFDPPLTDGLRAPALKGALSADQAFAKLLAGTSLRNKLLDDKTVTIVSRDSSQAAESLRFDKFQTPIDQDVNSNKEAGKKSSQDFRVAQATPGQTSSDVSVEKKGEEKKKAEDLLQVVVVTGSRIPQSAKEGAQKVKVYGSEQIEQSGQTTVADFLNTISDVSVSVSEIGFNAPGGATTVSLHGLPRGTTLVLVNGRRLGTSAAQTGTFFDLNNIPLAAVDRVEIVSEGSSAVYGSDAIAGVVNIILKKDFNGFEASVKYGGASGTDETDGSIALGQRWDKGSVSIMGTFQARTELEGSERSITANQDFRRYGGIDARTFDCNPGNVFTVDGSTLPGAPAGSNYSFAAVSPNASGNPRQTGFTGTYGALNQCSNGAFASLIPATDRAGIFAVGNYQLTPSVELFGELLFSHVHQSQGLGVPELFGQPGFQTFTVSASNPFNPFGETVGVSNALDVGRQKQILDTDFFLPLIGLRGDFFDQWHWEAAAWDSQDTSKTTITNSLNNDAIQSALNTADPSIALNPFIAGAQGTPQLLSSLVSDQDTRYRGQLLTANGFLRGPIFRLPSGPVEVVVGSEYARDKFEGGGANFAPLTARRNSTSIFGEARVPIVGNHDNPQADDILVATIAGRYDSYSDFGHKTTPQFGAAWRPFDSFLIRGTYSQAFKAPTLVDLYFPVFSFPLSVIDPSKGNQPVTVPTLFGGNPNLRPETGQSRTLGFVYSSKTFADFRLAVTHWEVNEANSIQVLSPQTIVDNENLFPGAVTRNSAGVITQVNAGDLNFGNIDVAGFNVDVSAGILTRFGKLSPSLSVTETYHYTQALTPGGPVIDSTSKANDDGIFAPRWKGSIALSWTLGPYAANVDGRYVGRYQDYDSTNQIGNFWLFDFNFRYAVGAALAPGSKWARSAYVEFGGVNIFDRSSQYSNFDFGGVGYDAAEADIRGRFLYLQIGSKW